MAKNVTIPQAPTHDEISARAHRIYESQGRPEGKDKEHWLKAEAQLIAERKAQAAKSPAKTAAAPAPAGNPPGNAPSTSGASGNRNWPGNPRQPVTQN